LSFLVGRRAKYRLQQSTGQSPANQEGLADDQDADLVCPTGRCTDDMDALAELLDAAVYLARADLARAEAFAWSERHTREAQRRARPMDALGALPGE